MYALIDANSFYASCESVFDPSIRDKPIVVLTNNDGCICAANRKAKELNIPKFEAYFKVREQCEKHGVVVRSSNYELYSDLSCRMMNVIGRYADEQYIYSIDESFLHFKNYQQVIDDFTSYGRQIRRAVYKETRLPVCVGIAATPTLAKAANHAAKKIKQYRGVAVIDNEGTRQYILSSMKVGDVWGIGRKISVRLNADNIFTALQLANMPHRLARMNFNVEIERTVRELNSEPCIHWDEVRQPKKQIYSTRSFGERVFDIELLREALSQHVTIAAKKLRQQNSMVKQMVIFASSSPFDKRPIHRKLLHKFAVPTNDTAIMLHAVSDAINKLFVSGVPFYRAGVGCLELIDSQFLQHDLFEPSRDNPTLMNCIDAINQRYGRDTVKHAAIGNEKKWNMRREFLSPAYTSDWSALPKIGC
ncbi:MAG: Y-family DNA polymerase [Psychrobium sp.]|nr:Y-family DNA polymerase [Psychrobium sp.]